MSVDVLCETWSRAPCKGADLLVLLICADSGNDLGMNLLPPIQLLAARARLSQDEAEASLKRLCDQRLMTVQPDPQTPGRTRFRIHLDYLRTLPAVDGEGASRP